MLKKYILYSDGLRPVRKNLFWLVYGLMLNPANSSDNERTCN